MFTERDEDMRKKRKLVIKYSLGQASPDGMSNADADLVNEYEILKTLR